MKNMYHQSVDELMLLPFTIFGPNRTGLSAHRASSIKSSTLLRAGFFLCTER